MYFEFGRIREMVDNFMKSYNVNIALKGNTKHNTFVQDIPDVTKLYFEFGRIREMVDNFMKSCNADIPLKGNTKHNTFVQDVPDVTTTICSLMEK